MNTAANGDERLIVMLEARISEFEKRMARAEGKGTKAFNNLRRSSKGATAQMEADIGQASSRINGALSSVSSQIGTFGKAFIGGLAVGAISAALGEITTNLRATLRGIADVGDSAKRSGLGLQAFQEWSFVADQNRVSVDALVDGFKELNLRADEWLATGGGSAAEAFQRLGFSASDLRERLKDPSALMLEIVGRLQRLDAAAQIRIADELFGGTGGEQFVQLLEQGEAGLRRTIERAHEVGRVMDAAMIAKAQELDRKWSELTDRVATFGKTAAVALADLPFDLVETRLNEIFGEAEGRSILGPQIYDQLREAGALTDEQVEKLRGLRGGYVQLEEAARLASSQMAAAADQADMMGYDDLWQTLADASNQLRQLADDFAAGTIDGETFRTKMEEVQGKTRDAFAAMDAADRVNFSGAISEVDRLGGVIATVTAKAQDLFNWLRAAAGMQPAAPPGTPTEPGAPAFEGRGRMGAGTAPAPTPRPTLDDLITRDTPRSSGSAGGGGGGGGGAAKRDDFAEAIAQMERETAMLQAETAAYLDAARAGEDYGNMVEYARKKAELMVAAQQQGLQITPELTAQIEEQARAYATAGVEAEVAADRIRRIQEEGRRGKEALGEVFDAIVEGGGRARQAIAELLMEMAKAQFREGMFGLLSMINPSGSFVSGIGSLLSGGREKGGGVKAGAAYMVNERTPRSEVFVPSQNGAILNVQQAQAALRGAAQSSSQPTATGGQTVIKLELSPDLEARILQQAGSQTLQMVKAADRRLPDRIAEINRNPRARK